jgi:hypothetical protein
MPAKKVRTGTSAVDAVQAVFAALEPLDDATRDRVLASVTALLGMAPATPTATGPAVAHVHEEPRSPSSVRPINVDRPKSLVELIQDKRPGTNVEKIALFAYYRERVEGLPRFARGDLKQYFAVAKEKPAANYDRDFANAVKAGWIHEDGSDSYLTSRGLEAVESGFPGGSVPEARKPSKRTAKRAKNGSRRKK